MKINSQMDMSHFVIPFTSLVNLSPFFEEGLYQYINLVLTKTTEGNK